MCRCRSGVSPFFTGVLVLLLVLLLAGPLAIVCMARRIGDEKTHKVTRGLTLDGGAWIRRGRAKVCSFARDEGGPAEAMSLGKTVEWCSMVL